MDCEWVLNVPAYLERCFRQWWGHTHGQTPQDPAASWLPSGWHHVQRHSQLHRRHTTLALPYPRHPYEWWPRQKRSLIYYHCHSMRTSEFHLVCGIDSRLGQRTSSQSSSRMNKPEVTLARNNSQRQREEESSRGTRLKASVPGIGSTTSMN